MGATFEFKLPDIGEGVSEGEIVEWHVAIGDKVKEDDPMVEVMTDKATVTIGAPRTGTIRELRFQVGAVAPVGSVLVVIDTEGAKGAPVKKDEPAATAVGDIRDALPGSKFFSSPAATAKAGNGGAAHAAPANTGYFEEKPLATPAVRKIARDLGVDLRHVQPTGDGGRVTREDIHTFAGGQAAMAAVPRAATPTIPATPATVRRAPGPQAAEERKPFVGIRRKIAERMQKSKNTAAHFTFVEECDVGRLKDLRARLAPAAEAAGTKLTFLPFIVKATVAALRKHPILNSMLDEAKNELVFRRDHHIGIATATEQGLMVPVVRDAGGKTLIEIAQEIERLSEGARKGSLPPGDLSGSTFTITSLGKQGGLFATPVLNFPEVGILGVHQMKQKPVVRDGQIVVGDVMLLSLSFDHRIVDGHVGAAFAYDLIAYLEEPGLLLLETV